MEKNTNIDVFEEILDNYLQSFEYGKAHVNVWMKYCNHTHIKGIQSWIKQNTQSKHGIMNLWIQR